MPDKSLPNAASSSDLRKAVLAVIALSMAPAVGLGIGRFAYALVLPDMQAAFGWSYGQAGFPNAMNALGYFIGAFTAGRLAALTGGLRLVLISSAAAALSTAVSAGATGLVSLSVLRFIAGVAAAHGLVAGGAVAIAIAEPLGKRGSLIVGMLYAGPPAGIFVSALVTPLALAVGGGENWRMAWLLLGGASAVMLAPLALPSLRDADGESRAVAGAPAPLRPMAPVLVAYCVFGAGYIAYMTFMIAFLRNGGATSSEESAFWCAIGLAGFVAPWLWSRALGALKGGLGFSAAAAVTCLGAAAPLLSHSFAAEIASGVVFGLGMFTTSAATTVFVRRNLPPAAWASGVGAMTVALSVGQTAGPVLTGFVTDQLGGLDAGLGFGAALLALGAAVSAIQRDRAPLAVAPPVSMPDDAVVGRGA